LDEQSRLSRRERQIMGIIYTRGKASVTEVWRALADPPSRTAVRTLLRILEEKGHLRHGKRGREFVYTPVRPRGDVGQSALKGVLTTFFDGSLEKAIAAHLAEPGIEIADEDLERLGRLIREAREKENS